MWKHVALAVMMGLLLIGCIASDTGNPTPKEPNFDEGRVTALEERVATLEAFQVPTRTPPPTTSPTSGPPPIDTVSWWPGEGHAEDIVGSNSGILVGPVGPTCQFACDTKFASGKVGQAFNLNHHYVDMGDVLDVGISSFSIALWYKREFARDVIVVNKGLTALGSPPDAGYGITIRGGSIRIELQDATQNKVMIGTTEPPLGQFHHVTAVVDRDEALTELYVDGVNVRQADISNVGSLDTDQAFGIGAKIIGAMSTESFGGVIDEIQFYDRALSDAEVEAIFDAAGP